MEVSSVETFVMDSSKGAEWSESKLASDMGMLSLGSDSTVTSKSICKEEERR